MVLSKAARKKFPVTQLGMDPGTVRLVVQLFNHYATPGPYIYIFIFILLFRIQNSIYHFAVQILLFLSFLPQQPAQ